MRGERIGEVPGVDALHEGRIHEVISPLSVRRGRGLDDEDPAGRIDGPEDEPEADDEATVQVDSRDLAPSGTGRVLPALRDHRGTDARLRAMEDQLRRLLDRNAALDAKLEVVCSALATRTPVCAM